VPLPLWRKLQASEPVEVGDRRIAPSAVLGPPRRGLRVVLATDTAPTAALARFIAADGAGADLLIADAMYPDEADKPTRWEAQHLTFGEAATLARDGGAQRLWLTHFSPAIPDPAAHLDRASAIFPATVVGYDGMTETLTFPDE
jgi:ribonuclease Z